MLTLRIPHASNRFFNQLGEGFFGGVEDTLKKESTDSGRLRAYLEFKVRYHVDHIRPNDVEEQVLLEIDYHSRVNPKIHRAIQRWTKMEYEKIAEILQKGVENGAFEIDDVPLMSLVVSNTIDSLIHPWSDTTKYSVKRKTEKAIHLILDGLRKRA